MANDGTGDVRTQSRWPRAGILENPLRPGALKYLLECPVRKEEEDRVVADLQGAASHDVSGAKYTLWREVHVERQYLIGKRTN